MGFEVEVRWVQGKCLRSVVVEVGGLVRVAEQRGRLLSDRTLS